jgi:hypothetical protein
VRVFLPGFQVDCLRFLYILKDENDVITANAYIVSGC